MDASIPVPEHLVNELIEVSLRGNKNISACRVSINGQNKVTLQLKTPLWLWPINIKLQLASSVDISGSPKIRASLENNVLLGKLGSLFKALPEGVNIDGDQVIIDVRAFLETPEQRRMLDLLKSAEVSTESGRVTFDIQIKVE